MVAASVDPRAGDLVDGGRFADHGHVLEAELLTRFEGVEPGGQKRLQGGGDGGVGRQPVHVTVVDQ